jgi:hypothetical protein
MKEEGLGAKFWLSMIGIIVAIGVGGMIFFLLFSRAVYAWGFVGAIAALGLVFILIAIWYDHRKKREYAEFEAEIGAE